MQNCSLLYPVEKRSWYTLAGDNSIFWDGLECSCKGSCKYLKEVRSHLQNSGETDPCNWYPQMSSEELLLKGCYSRTTWWPKNDPQRLIYMSAWSSVGEAVWGLGGMVSLEEVCHWGRSLLEQESRSFPVSPHSSPFSPPSHFMLVEQDKALSYSSSTMPAYRYAPSHDDHGL